MFRCKSDQEAHPSWTSGSFAFSMEVRKGRSRRESKGSTQCILGKFLRELTFISGLLYATPCPRHLWKSSYFLPSVVQWRRHPYLIYPILETQEGSNLPKVSNSLCGKVRTWTHICLLSKSLLFLFPMLLLTPSLEWEAALVCIFGL